MGRVGRPGAAARARLGGTAVPLDGRGAALAGDGRAGVRGGAAAGAVPGAYGPSLPAGASFLVGAGPAQPPVP